MNSRHALVCLAFLGLVFLGGCAQNMARSSSSASLTNLIEPVKDSRQVATKAALTLPVSVAIVAVPSHDTGRGEMPVTTLRLASEKLKRQLLANSKYVSSVSVVDRDDFQGKISLERIRGIYDADVAIILSYHQDQRSMQNGFFGLLDATVAGAFLVPGVAIETSSVIDGKVIHIPSNAIIFRSSGTDERTTHSTSYAVQTSFTEASIESLQAATTAFGDSLNKKLDRFDHFDLSRAVLVPALSDQEAAGANNYWKKVNTYKSTGGGAFGLIPLLISGATCCAAWWRK